MCVCVQATPRKKTCCPAACLQSTTPRCRWPTHAHSPNCTYTRTHRHTTPPTPDSDTRAHACKRGRGHFKRRKQTHVATCMQTRTLRHTTRSILLVFLFPAQYRSSQDEAEDFQEAGLPSSPQYVSHSSTADMDINSFPFSGSRFGPVSSVL